MCTGQQTRSQFSIQEFSMFSSRTSKINLFTFAWLAVVLAVVFSAIHIANAASLPTPDRVCVDDIPQLQCLPPHDPPPAASASANSDPAAPASIPTALAPVAAAPVVPIINECSPFHGS